MILNLKKSKSNVFLQKCYCNSLCKLISYLLYLLNCIHLNSFTFIFKVKIVFECSAKTCIVVKFVWFLSYQGWQHIKNYKMSTAPVTSHRIIKSCTM